MKPDFSGYATKSGIKCSDGLTIGRDAFKHYDGKKLPLVWSHDHSSPENVLGHAIIEHRDEGSFIRGYFNDTPMGKISKQMVEHKDLDALSIYANRLVKGGVDGKTVQHGELKEVSLVIAGANPEAVIENVYLQHADGSIDESDSDVIIHSDPGVVHLGDPDEEEESTDETPDAEVTEENTDEKPVTDGVNVPVIPEAAPTEAIKPVETSPAEPVVDENLEHADTKETNVADEGTKSVKDVFDGFSDEQKNVVYYMIGSALEDAGVAHSDEEGTTVGRNVFENDDSVLQHNELSHDQIKTIVRDADKKFGSFKDSVLAHADEYGITNIDLLFPDAKTVGGMPELVARQADWVPKVLGGTKHVPFAKIKSISADLTAEEARAKGYIKGTEKKEEVIPILRRTTGPTTIYKKQKLDRDDILDITDFDVVAWLKWEIRFMLDEEIARAILIGDGRSVLNPDKIKDPAGAATGDGIRSIANDHELYAIKLNLVANVASDTIIKEITRARTGYRGSGQPTLYTTDRILVDMLLLEDKMGRRLYETEQSLAAALRVKEIVPVEVMEEEADLLGIIVNLTDYSVGTNQGGQVTFFEDFDIDFNQEKYLMETRLSGALTKPKSAIVIRREQGTEVTPTAPQFNGATNVLTVPTKAGVIYTIADDLVTGNVTITEDVTLEAQPDDGYYFPAGTTRAWPFIYNEDA